MLLGFPFTRPSATLSPVGGEGRVRGQHSTGSGDIQPHDGSTLGGTIAAGLSGPGRFRFGGVRDFILGVRFVDGAGRLLRMGGKVVKNAAGFDLPKFFVGSLGRFGVLAEMTFKVFPRPTSTLTLKLPVKDAGAAALVLTEAANARWEADALDYLPEASNVFLRLAGPAAALDEIAREILARWPGEELSPEEADNFWTQLREFTWTATGGPLLKVPLTPAALPGLDQAVRSLNSAQVHVSAGGNVAFVSLTSASDAASLDGSLRKLGLSGVTLRGDAPLWCGVRPRPQIASAVKQALDPQNRFPSLDD
jgi:glycolate oxidase FAD binding subunit